MFDKKITTFSFVFFLIALVSCNNDGQEGSLRQVEPTDSLAAANASPVEQMRAVAIEETDYLERIRQSFVPLQEEYQKANGKVPGIGVVNIFVDEKYTLLIENTHKDHVYQTKVNLKNLNNQQGGMMLIPDQSPGEYPGLKVLVKEGKPGVEKIKDGKLEKEERQLDIFLADRPGIERVTPAILQALNIANGNFPAEQ